MEMSNDLINRDALKNYARTVLCEDNATNCSLLKIFDEIIDNAPTGTDRYGEGYAQGYIDGSTGADWKGSAE